MKRMYLDYAASAPVDKHVKAAMNPYFSEVYGNAGSVHQLGQEASAAIFKARKTIAEAIGAKYDEIIFTGSATEANNLALRGAIKEFRIQNIGLRNGALSKNKKSLDSKSHILTPRLIISAFEHASVLETAKDLEKEGVEVVYIPVSRDGFVDLKKLETALNERTVLVSVMYVNNEVGTIQPIAEIAEAIQEYRIQNIEYWKNKNPKFNIQNSTFYPLLHTDAVQAFQYLNCNVDQLGVDLMTLSAHKIYGPKGIGALYVGKMFNETSDKRQEQNKNSRSHFTLPILPIVTGGGQEPGGLWSGTPNTPSIVGFGKAVEISRALRNREAKRVRTLRDYCWKKLKKAPAVQLNGFLEKRVPNNLNIYFPGQKAHELVIKLDLVGIAVSSGVACSARVVQPSPVLKAMGFLDERALGSLRITFGRQTIKKEIDYFVKILEKIVGEKSC